MDDPEGVLGRERRTRGRPFQVEGPTTENARLCLVEVRARGTKRFDYITFQIHVMPFQDKSIRGTSDLTNLGDLWKEMQLYVGLFELCGKISFTLQLKESLICKEIASPWICIVHFLSLGI